MTEIIDLAFYRKFRIILPIRPRAPFKHKAYGVARTAVKQLRRRRRNDPESKIPKE